MQQQGELRDRQGRAHPNLPPIERLSPPAITTRSPKGEGKEGFPVKGRGKRTTDLDTEGGKGYFKSTEGVRSMDQKVQDVIADLKAYLEYLKGMGIEGLPAAEEKADKIIQPEGPTLDEIRRELGDCKRCKLHRTRRTLVFGEGNEKARLMLIGEGPGYDEDVQGRPFVGRAGQLLTKILQSISFQREEVYIANIIKCRPPQNRNPEPDEIQSCYPFLMKQIQAIQPRIICALGAFAAHTLLQTDAKITALRGRIFDLSGIQVFPTYHPAFLLRNPERKREVWEDMKRIAEEMAKEDGRD
jgi:DNA polymerase